MLQQIINIIIPVQQAFLLVWVDFEMFFPAGGEDDYFLVGQVNFQLGFRISFNSSDGIRQKVFRYLHREQAVVEGIVHENISKKAGNHSFKTKIINGPCGMFTAGTAAEILSCNQDFS